MRRLMHGRLARGRGRLGDERGAVAIMVALLLVPLLGFGAIAVDVAAVHAERQELRNGTDAAALAIATDCAWSRCGNTPRTAADLIAANAGSMSAEVGAPDVRVDPGAGSVAVTATATQNHYFAPLIGVESTNTSATSVAAWSGISHATADLPVAISRCEYDRMKAAGGLRTLYPGEPGTCGSAGVPPVIWLNTDAGACRTSDLAVGATLSRFVPAKRTDMPAACRPSGGAFPLNSVVDRQVHIPVFDQSSAIAAPKVYGFVAFDVDDVTLNERSYKFTSWLDWFLHLLAWLIWGWEPAAQGFKAIGTLGTSVELSDAPVNTISAPDLGARSVYLTERNPK